MSIEILRYECIFFINWINILIWDLLGNINGWVGLYKNIIWMVKDLGMYFKIFFILSFKNIKRIYDFD